MPRRIQRRRTPGWRMPAGVVYVGRPTYWGNPFVAGKPAIPGYGTVKVRDRAHAVELYREYLRRTGKDHDARRMLAGRDLACWCPLAQPCHASLLLWIANGEAPCES
jgi:hypothetical protein